MKSYSYFPGCSSSEGTASAYGKSIEAITEKLGIELIELEDWNCCGSTPYYSINELESLCVGARNLALAEKEKRDLVTPCSACYTVLSRVNTQLRKYPDMKKKVDECLAAAGLEYHLGVTVRHLFEAIYTDIGVKQIEAGVTNPLKGLKVAPYYGCQMVRPESAFADKQNPQAMEKYIAALGAESTRFDLKDRCCGGALIIPELDITLILVRNILESASRGGAQCLMTVCPLCQTVLDAYQNMANKKFGTSYHLPVLFFSQLTGLAMGVKPGLLALNKCVISAEKLLAPYTHPSLAAAVKEVK